MRYVLCAALAAIALLAISSAPTVAQPGITIRQVLQSRTTLTGQPIEFPHFRNQVTATLTELAPDGQTGSTTLVFPSVVYQMQGTSSLAIAGLAATAIGSGQALVAPLRTPFNGANRGSTPAKFLTVSFGEQG